MDKGLYRASLVLVIIGLLVSIYMTIYKVTSNDSLCLGSGDCATVNASRYSEVSGIPVAVVGILGYAAMLAVHWFERRNSFFKETGTLLIFGMALTGFIFTVWLGYVGVAFFEDLSPFFV